MSPSRIVPLCLALAACAPRPARVEPPAPVPQWQVIGVPNPELVIMDPIRICVVKGGRLVNVEGITYNPVTGDTLIGDKLFRDVYPTTAQYALNALWYINRESIRVNGLDYHPYGLPRVLGVNELARHGEYRGVPLFVEAGNTQDRPDVLYVPVNIGCEFQPYEQHAVTGAVRGR